MEDRTILHYKILDEIGKGGMSVVYKALDTKLDRIVAIKFFSQHVAQHRERFIIEAKAPTFLKKRCRRVGALNHPNITTIHAIEEVGNELLAQLKGVSQQRYISRCYLAAAYVGLNENEQALAELEKACHSRDCWLANLSVDPKFDSLRTDARFNALIQRIGF